MNTSKYIPAVIAVAGLTLGTLVSGNAMAAAIQGINVAYDWNANDAGQAVVVTLNTEGNAACTSIYLDSGTGSYQYVKNNNTPFFDGHKVNYHYSQPSDISGGVRTIKVKGNENCTGELTAAPIYIYPKNPFLGGNGDVTKALTPNPGSVTVNQPLTMTLHGTGICPNLNATLTKDGEPSNTSVSLGNVKFNPDNSFAKTFVASFPKSGKWTVTVSNVPQLQGCSGATAVVNVTDPVAPQTVHVPTTAVKPVDPRPPVTQPVLTPQAPVRKQ